MTTVTPSTEKNFGCETCPMRKKAEANPKSFMAMAHTLVPRLESVSGLSG